MIYFIKRKKMLIREVKTMYLCVDGECVDHCGEGFFVDEETGECEPCHRRCRTCGGPRYDDCDSCEDGSLLKNGGCLEGRQLALCPEKHFRNSTAKVTFISVLSSFPSSNTLGWMLIPVISCFNNTKECNELRSVFTSSCKMRG